MAGGLLSGKYRRGHRPPSGSRDLAAWGEPPVRDQELLHDIVEELVEIADRRGVSPAQVALAWTLARPTSTGSNGPAGCRCCIPTGTRPVPRHVTGSLDRGYALVVEEKAFKAMA